MASMLLVLAVEVTLDSPDTPDVVSDPESAGAPQEAALSAIRADIPTAVIFLNREHNPFQNLKAIRLKPLISDIVLGQGFVPGQYF